MPRIQASTPRGRRVPARALGGTAKIANADRHRPKAEGVAEPDLDLGRLGVPPWRRSRERAPARARRPSLQSGRRGDRPRCEDARTRARPEVVTVRLEERYDPLRQVDDPLGMARSGGGQTPESSSVCCSWGSSSPSARASSSAPARSSASASASWPSWVSRPPTRVSSSAWSATPGCKSCGRRWNRFSAAGRSPRAKCTAARRMQVAHGGALAWSSLS